MRSGEVGTKTSTASLGTVHMGLIPRRIPFGFLSGLSRREVMLNLEEPVQSLTWAAESSGVHLGAC